MTNHKLHIGFVSTRFAGNDGVSLETAKWAKIFTGLGHTCFYFAGESDLPSDRSHVVPEAHFDHPLVKKVHTDLFDDYRRSPQTSEIVRELWGTLKRGLVEFLKDFGIKLLVVENAMAIPMNVPLGLALTELISETNIPTIAHHHDFYWERTRYAVNAAEDYIQAAFPPAMSTIHHVVINSFAAKQLAFRTGMSSKYIPNVMDFDNPPLDSDEYAEDLREVLELERDDVFLLQPTRIVPRKRIERAIELAHWLEMPCALIISHGAGDEGYDYHAYLKDYAQMMSVRVIFGEDIFTYERQRNSEGKKIYSLKDAYQQSDLVTYPSSIEGFGNAFLEAIYYRRPLMMSSYDIFKADISPKGFQVIVFDEFITKRTVEHTISLLKNPSQIQKIVENNYELGKKYYSYTVLRKHLSELIEQCFQA